MKITNLEPTPNPNAFKFNIEEKLGNRARSFPDAVVAEQDPLAKILFEVEGVESIFYLGHFITVTKEPESSTEEVLKATGQLILDFDYTELEELLAEEEPASEEANEELSKINQVLDEMVRPALANDGGGLEIVGYDNNTLFIQYQGACGTCPSAARGTLMQIEMLLKHQINPDISVVPS